MGKDGRNWTGRVGWAGRLEWNGFNWEGWEERDGKGREVKRYEG